MLNVAPGAHSDIMRLRSFVDDALCHFDLTCSISYLSAFCCSSCCEAELLFELPHPAKTTVSMSPVTPIITSVRFMLLSPFSTPLRARGRRPSLTQSSHRAESAPTTLARQDVFP